jgi:hypothetical protein
MKRQYYIGNLDRKEYLDPSELGYCPTLHLWQIAANNCLKVLALLLRQGSGCGTGDIQKPCANAGRWAGQRIAIIGRNDPSGIFEQCRQGIYREITDEIREEWNDFIQRDELQIPWYAALHGQNGMGDVPRPLGSRNLGGNDRSMSGVVARKQMGGKPYGRLWAQRSRCEEAG